MMFGRQLGSTTAAVKAALDHDGVLICATEREASRLRAQHRGLRAVSAQNPNTLIGNTRPVLVDHHAMEAAMMDADRERANARMVGKINDGLQSAVADLRAALAAMTAERDALRARLKDLEP